MVTDDALTTIWHDENTRNKLFVQNSRNGNIWDILCEFKVLYIYSTLINTHGSAVRNRDNRNHHDN